jgi:general secretion pathway protein G
MVKRAGFTLIELLVVMTLVALLLTLALPRYFSSVERGRETTLRENLKVMRAMIDRHYADTGRYPERLQELVERRYLSAVPLDPITQSAATWTLVPPRDADARGVYDVKSGAQGQTREGVAFTEL